MTAQKPIFAVPLTPTKTLDERMRHFPEHIYNTKEGSHLRNFLDVLCGDAGANDLKKKLLLARLQRMLGNVNFFDLDKLFGNPLRFPRISSEIYPYNPYSDYLTTDEWDEVKVKDSIYRGRILKYMKGIDKGVTKEGLSMIAEAALGVQVDVVENYRYLDGGFDTTNQVLGRLDVSSREEITLVPNSATITKQEERRVLHAIDRLRKIDRIFTVSLYGVPIHKELKTKGSSVCASSEYTERRLSVYAENWPFPKQGNSWIEAGDENEARYRAFTDHQDWSDDMMSEVKEVSASSYQVGPFNPIQIALFDHLPSQITTGMTFNWEPAACLRKKNSSVPILTSWVDERRKGY